MSKSFKQNHLIFVSSRDNVVELDNSISEDAIRILIDNGLKNQAPEACETFLQGLEASHRHASAQIQQEEKGLRKTLDDDLAAVADAIRRRLTTEILKLFRCVPYTFVTTLQLD